MDAGKSFLEFLRSYDLLLYELLCARADLSFNVNGELVINGDLFPLQRQMGHTDLQMTKRYTEISDKLLVECHQNYSPIGLLQDSSRRVKV